MDKAVGTSIGNIDKSYKLWQKSSGKTASANEKHGRKVESLTKQMGLLDTAISKSEKELGKIEQKYGVNSKEAEEYRSKVLDLKLSHAELGESLDKTNKEFANAGVQTKSLGDKFRDLDTECGKIDKKFEVFDKIGDNFSNFGRKMTMGVTLPVVGAGIAAGKMAMDFTSGVSKVTTVADMSKISVDKITTSIMDMSNQTGISTSELNEALYQTISAGVDTAHSVEFLADATKLAEAGFADIGPTIDALTSILNAYGLEATETTRISDVLIQAQNLGKLSVSELSGAIGRVIPSAKNANVSIEQLSSAYVEMTKNGVSVNESTTYINSLFNEMSKSGTKVDKILKQVAGKSFPDLMKEGKSLGDVLAILDDHAKKNNLSLADLYGSAEASKSAMILASEGGKKFNSTLEQLQNSAGSTDKAFKTMSETTEYKFRKAMNQAKNSIMQFGITAMPAITKVIEKVSSMLETFGNLSPATQKWIINAALMAAAIGPLSSGIGGLIKGITGLCKGIGKAGAFFGIFGKGATAATTVTSGLGKAAAVTGGAKGIGALISGLGGAVSAASPFILAGGAIAGACVLMKKSFDKAAESAKAEIVPSFGQAVDSMEGLSDATKVVVKDVNEQISKIEGKIITFQADGSIVKEEVTELSNDIISLIDNTINHVNQKLQKGGEGVASFYNTLNEEQKKTYNQGVEEAKKAQEEEVKILEEKKKRVQEIEETARKQNRELTQAELAELTLIIGEAEEAQLQARIESSEQYMTYKANMHQLEISATKDTALQVVESAVSVKDEKKKIIEEEYKNTVAHIKENLKLNEEQTTELLNQAEEYKNERLNKTEAEYNGILATVREKFPELMDYIDESTGKILSDQEAAAKQHERIEREKWNNAKISAKDAYSTLQNMGKYNADQEEAHLLQCINAWKKYSSDVDSQIDAVRRAFEQGAIDKNTYQKEIDRLTANKTFASEQISALQGLIQKFSEGKISASELKRAIAELQSKTITITTEYHTVGAPPEVTGRPQMVGPKNTGTFSLPRRSYDQGTFSLPKISDNKSSLIGFNQGTFTLPKMSNATNSNIGVIVHDSSTGSHGEVMDLPGGTRIYPHDVSMRMARETAKSVAEELLNALNINSSNNSEIIVPVILDGREIARVTTPYISNNLANNFNRKR